MEEHHADDRQGAKGIVMAPQDTAAVAPTLTQLESKKIPVVTIDTRPDTGNVFMVVRADNRAYGEKSCQFLGTKLKGKGKVVELMGDVASIEKIFVVRSTETDCEMQEGRDVWWHEAMEAASPECPPAVSS